MREILFRGKCIENGEWVYCYYAHIPCGRFKKEEHLIQTIKKDGTIGSLHDVIPDTVGQYTGLNDKNGAMIFEGDILRVSKYGETYLSKIVFNEKTAGFEFWWKFICGEYGELATGKYNMAQFEDIEVIGNIYDTPELLGVEK